MTNKIGKYWLAIFIISGILSEIFLLTMRFNPLRGQIINYDVVRWILGGIVGILLVAAMVILMAIFFRPEITKEIFGNFNQRILKVPSRLFTIQFLLLLSSIFVAELLLMSFISIPEPLRPILLWSWLNLLMTWLLFRIGYRELYLERKNVGERIKGWWKSLLVVQKRVFVTLAILGAIYFATFIPLNGLPDPGNYGSHFGHADEVVIYPSVIRVLTIGETFTETVFNILIDYNWWYGYPYLPISASVLI
ncbi:hypothetical protein ACFLXB_02930, partial [Chloroflexota bacterium]